jgi:hypothetical protein
VEDDLVLVKGFEEVVGGFEDGFGFDFHWCYYLKNGKLVLCERQFGVWNDDWLINIIWVSKFGV